MIIIDHHDFEAINVNNTLNYIPSASVILLRQNGNYVETLLLKKNSKITFGGSWVFPGGKIDHHEKSELDSPFDAERRAASRECKEESGLTIDGTKLHPISRWKTPVIRPKRFSTVFFLYNAQEIDQEVQIDHGEIVEANWFNVSHVIEMHDNKEITLAGPAYVTLTSMASFEHIDDVFNHYQSLGFQEFVPRIQLSPSGAHCLYDGDGCYADLDDHSTSECSQMLQKIESCERKHRLIMSKDKPWEYINTTNKNHQ